MKSIVTIIFCSILSSLLAVGAYRFIEVKYLTDNKNDKNYAKHTSLNDYLFNGKLQRSFLSSAPTNFISAAQATTPAVVNIRSGIGASNFWSDEGYGVSTGSGVVVSDDGYIVTNNHVIEGSTNIEVTLADKREFEAKVVGKDPSTDIALLKIEASDLESLVFGNSDSLSVGEWVLAVGNPFNLESTVTAGIVSAKGRDINILDDKYRIESFIQTDAAVNPGNSGGALVNTNGELVGINSAIITRSGRYEGYSFAIPSNLVRKIIKDLMDFGTVQRGILGVNIENVTNQLANELKLPNVEGVIITGLTKDGSAIGSGLKEGDIILSIDGVKTKTVPQLQELVARYRPGNKLTIEYFRSGQKYKVDLILKNRLNNTDVVKFDRIFLDLGFEARDLTPAEKKEFKSGGLKIISITRGGIIDRTNMDAGFIVTKINEKEVTDLQGFTTYLKSLKGKVMLEGFYDTYPGEYYYAFKLE